MTEKHYLLSNKELEAEFKNCKLSPKHFTHEAHLRLAYIHIQRYGLKQAIKNLCAQIANFDTRYGDGTKFNTRITIASAKIVALFMGKAKSTSFKEMLLEFPQLRSNFCELLRKHYKLDFFKQDKEEDYLETNYAVLV